MDLIEAMPKLLARTQEGKLKWEEFGAASFIATVGSVLVSISSASTSYKLGLHDRTGSTLESETLSIVSDTTNYRIAEELYETARRQALAIDVALDELRRGLDEL